MPDAGSSTASLDAGATVVLDASGVRRTLTRLAHEIVEATQGVSGLVLVVIGVPVYLAWKRPAPPSDAA